PPAPHHGAQIVNEIAKRKRKAAHFPEMTPAAACRSRRCRKSRRAFCVQEVGAKAERGSARSGPCAACGGEQRRVAGKGRIAPGDERTIGEAVPHVAVGEARAVRRRRDAARCADEGIARGDVPLHGPPEARIDVRFARSDEAELEGGGSVAPLARSKGGEEAVRFGI